MENLQCKDIQESDLRTYLFTARKDCCICGRKFLAGEKVLATFYGRAAIYMGRHENGPWVGGYTTYWLKNNALEIYDTAGGEVIYRNTFTPAPEREYPNIMMAAGDSGVMEKE
jgi:hypothetical protein